MRVSPPALNTSAGIPSGPGALPVCSCLMAASASAALGGASSSVGHQDLCYTHTLNRLFSLQNGDTL